MYMDLRYLCLLLLALTSLAVSLVSMKMGLSLPQDCKPVYLPQPLEWDLTSSIPRFSPD